ncbi:DNA primase [Alteromonas oceanisediminis]|uniref:DNA primase n=1 Tax=Alteromonas oceanisediminis TaxID=2836180 RepID=UPI001BD9CD0D|nr:DNA primase [Alteromonas oceanisediminis]MBT0585307.1 DNA primase [Alteromonas oceanisediminis]
MAGMIPRDFIDDMIARTDIVDIVDSRVKLKKAGKNYQACCPFHNEKSPSFTVSQDKQFYHCFGCGVHGNAISFLMEFDRLEFPEAIEELARYHGVDVPREKGNPSDRPSIPRAQLDNDYALMDKATKFFQQQLKKHANSEHVISYLKKRGLSGETVKHWEIGYAPSEWDAVLSQFGKGADQSTRQQQLLDLKLITENDNGKRFDFFRDRVMFPIRDKRGRVIGFGGRVLDEGGPKYLNSPETRIFHKGNELYGFYQAKQAHRQLDKVLIVEGYMDVVALAQYGIDYAVASLGTSTTPEHIQMLVRATNDIICCYDGDRAGREAAWRAMENALPYLKDGVTMRFLFLPDGEDPDTMVQSIGQQAFEAKLDEAQPLSRFLFDNLMQQHNVSSSEGKAALKAHAQPLIEKILGDNQRDLLLEELSRLCGERDRYRRDRDIQQANQNSSRPRYVPSGAPQKTTISPVRMMIRLLLDNPSLAIESPQVDLSALVETAIPGLDVLVKVHQFCAAHPHAHTGVVLEHFRNTAESRILSKLLTQEHFVSDEGAKAEYADSFAKLINWHCEQRMEQLMVKARVSGLSADEKQELNLLMQAKKPG